MSCLVVSYEESFSGQQDVFRHHPGYIFRVVVLLEERTETRQSTIEIRKCSGPHFLFPQKF